VLSFLSFGYATEEFEGNTVSASLFIPNVRFLLVPDVLQDIMHSYSYSGFTDPKSE